jgi:hypothetical protein
LLSPHSSNSPILSKEEEMRQQVQKLETLTGQQPALPSLRVALLRPSFWKRVQDWARRALADGTVAEVTLGAATVFLAAWLFVSFSQALQHYTIIPMP